MKKYLYALLLMVGMLFLAAACENNTADEDSIYIDSPDPGDVQRPGGGNG